MSTLISHEFTLSMTPGGVPPRLKITQYDTARTFTANLRGEDGSAWTIPGGATVTIEGTNAQRVPFELTATASGSAVTFTPDEIATAQPGLARATVVIKNGDDRIATLLVEFDVQRNGATEEEIAASPGFTDVIDAAVAAWLGTIGVGAINSAVNAYADEHGLEYGAYYVTPAMFGAVGDGVNDDTDAMIACCECATANNLPIVWHDKTIYLKTATSSHCPRIMTDVDFSGCEILITSENDAHTILKVGEDPDELSGISSVTANNYKTVFAQYPDSVVSVVSNISLGTRLYDSSPVTHYHRQTFLTNAYGEIEPYNPFIDLTSVSTVYRVDKLSEPITLRFGTIRLSGANSMAKISIKRSNVTVCDTSVVSDNITGTTFDSGLFEASFCANVKFSNIVGNNLAASNTVWVTQYIMDAYYCYGLIFERININKGWGAMASHWCTDIVMRDSKLNRFDIHYGTFGRVVVENCDFIEYPASILLGYGDGDVSINDCTFHKRTEGNRYSEYIINLRSDFAILFSGKIRGRNNEIRLGYNESSKHVWMFNYNMAFAEFLSYAPSHLPELDMVDTRIVNETAPASGSRAIVGLVNLSNNADAQPTVGKMRFRFTSDSLDKTTNESSLQGYSFADFNSAAAVFDIENAYFKPLDYNGSLLTSGLYNYRYISLNESTVEDAVKAICNYINDSNLIREHGVANGIFAIPDAEYTEKRYVIQVQKLVNQDFGGYYYRNFSGAPGSITKFWYKVDTDVYRENEIT